ncbi:hemin uptake protein HemP [Shimia sp.]|uniref:hemin uptake protein HemP n=1 Tax=Shimia sp. TaxID=1954381 RepID=UPI003298F846
MNTSPAQTPATTPTWAATELTHGGQLAQIRLGEQEYVLRITRAGKLILTK